MVTIGRGSDLTFYTLCKYSFDINKNSVKRKKKLIRRTAIIKVHQIYLNLCQENNMILKDGK